MFQEEWLRRIDEAEVVLKGKGKTLDFYYQQKSNRQYYTARLLEMDDTISSPFGTIEMAFVYGVVTLALSGSGAPRGPDKVHGRRERVACLLSQAGYDVTVAVGRRNGEPSEWMEVGRLGCTPVLIVDISAPDRPRDTVLLKRSKAGRLYSRRDDGH